MEGLRTIITKEIILKILETYSKDPKRIKNILLELADSIEVE